MCPLLSASAPRHQDAEFLSCQVLDRIFFGPPFLLSAPMYTLVSPACVHLTMDRVGVVLQNSQLLGIGFPTPSQLSIQWRYKWKSFSVLRKDLIINTSLSVEVHNMDHGPVFCSQLLSASPWTIPFCGCHVQPWGKHLCDQGRSFKGSDSQAYRLLSEFCF